MMLQPYNWGRCCLISVLIFVTYGHGMADDIAGVIMLLSGYCSGRCCFVWSPSTARSSPSASSSPEASGAS